MDYEREYYVPDKEDNSQLIHVDDCILFATLFGRKEVFESVKFQNRYAAERLGLSTMSLEDINAEIKAVRRQNAESRS
jgi:hypothetical protein